MSIKRVVITGIGVVSSFGADLRTTWQSLLNGETKIGPIIHFNPDDLPVRFAGTIADRIITEGLPDTNIRKLDRFVQYGLLAGIKAVEDARFPLKNEQLLTQTGIAVGSGIGGLHNIESAHEKLLARGPRRISPFLIPSTILNAIASQLSIHFQIKGPSLSIVTACATGLHNIAVAARMIAYGDAIAMLAGGSEAACTPLSMAGFAALKALSCRNDHPQTASRPFDQTRDGFVLSDGAGVLVLEEYQHALRRGAPMYAEIAGIGMSSDAHHITSPDPDGKGAYAAMQAALKNGKVVPEQIGYINPHATGTPLGDQAEIKAIRQVFDETALKKLCISGTKSMTGHLLGAAGAVELAITSLALSTGYIPPTINLENPDPMCVGLNLVPRTAQEHRIEYALCNGFGFGGSNASILLKRIHRT